ncbi:hypothetical protein [Yoonia sp. R2-816]|uniref:hypothetical protein n=1 Tax=Yoonia sp. R2-816 TaxID=3342638 RepID=UPI003726F94D
MLDKDIQVFHMSNILELKETAIGTNCECPKCLQRAKRVSWEKAEGRAVNRYWRMFCIHCGHVDTNVITSLQGCMDHHVDFWFHGFMVSWFHGIVEGDNPTRQIVLSWGEFSGYGCEVVWSEN